VNTVASLIVGSLAKLTEAMEAQNDKLWTSSDSSYDLQTQLSELKKKQKELPKEERVLPNAEWVRSALAKLPQDQVTILRQIATVMHEATKPQHLETNQMSSTKLAMCVLPAIMTAVKVMIEKFEDVFGWNETEGAELNDMLRRKSIVVQKASEISEQMKIAQESEVDEKLRELDERQARLKAKKQRDEELKVEEAKLEKMKQDEMKG